MVRVSFLLFALALMLFACENGRKETTYYFPMDSLVEAQVFTLFESGGRLSKEAVIGDKHEQAGMVNDTTGWRNELSIFAQLNDINKASNRGLYRVEKGKRDVNSNLLIYSMECTEPRPVEYLKIYYLGDLKNLRKIEARYHEEDLLLSSARLLSSTRELTMNFENINNKIVLTSYSITGGQKTMLGDSVQFSVNGMITLP